jgi:hypothetical protein
MIDVAASYSQILNFSEQQRLLARITASSQWRDGFSDDEREFCDKTSN